MIATIALIGAAFIIIGIISGLTASNKANKARKFVPSPAKYTGNGRIDRMGNRQPTYKAK